MPDKPEKFYHILIFFFFAQAHVHLLLPNIASQASEGKVQGVVFHGVWGGVCGNTADNKWLPGALPGTASPASTSRSSLQWPPYSPPENWRDQWK